MSHQHTPAMDLEVLEQEHGFLRSWLVSLRRELNRPATTVAQALEWLSRLRNEVTQHFRQEESGGYFAEIVSSFPRLAKRAQGLEAEHTVLVAQLEGMLADLRQAAPLTTPTPTLVLRFSGFVETFLAHEECENELLQLTAEDEPSTAD